MQRMKGASLLQLLTGTCLLLLLAAAAVPAYQQYVLRSRHSEVVGMLQQNALFLEAHYQQHGSYKSTPTLWPVLPYSQSGAAGNAYHIVFGSTPRNTDEGYFLLKANSADGEWELSLTQTGVLKRCQIQSGQESCVIWQ